MSFFEAVKSVFKKYATFSGRARRSEYWFFVLFNIAVSALISICFGTARNTFGSTLSSLFSLGVFLPYLAVTWRRLHDIGESGKTAIMPYASFAFSVGLVVIAAVADSTFLIIVSIAALIASLVFLIRLIVLLAKDSQPGDNGYGPNPKYSTARSNPAVYTAPARAENSYSFQRNDAPMDEIQAVVEGKYDDGKVSLWGEDNGLNAPTPVAPRNDKSFCPSCGAMTGKDEKFCSNCGTKL